MTRRHHDHDDDQVVDHDRAAVGPLPAVDVLSRDEQLNRREQVEPTPRVGQPAHDERPDRAALQAAPEPHVPARPTAPLAPTPKLVVEAPPRRWSTMSLQLDHTARTVLSADPARTSAVVVNRGSSTVRLAPEAHQVPTGFRLAPGETIEVRHTAAVHGCAVDASGVPASGTTSIVDTAAEQR